MATMGERIRIARGAMSKRRLAKAVGVSHQTVGLWEAGENEPKRDNLKNLSRELGVKEEWLISGDASAYSENVTPGPRTLGRVPVIEWERVLELSEAVEIKPIFSKSSLPCPVECGPRTFALVVDGDSMTAPHGRTYPAGCLIFVDPDAAADVVSGDRVLAELDNEKSVSFKVYVKDGGKRLLKPLNPIYPMIAEPFRIIGKVLGQFSE